MRATLLVAAALSGCLYTPVKAPPRVADTKTAPAPDGPHAHTQRLGWVHWPSNTTVETCNRRLDDAGNPVGVLGPCFSMSVGDSGYKKMVDWLNNDAPEQTPLERTPDPRCSIELQDAQLAPHATAARATFVMPPGKTLLAEWTPAPDQVADLFVMEPSYSPDGKTLALLRLGIGLGEGERTVEIAGITLSAAPFCQHFVGAKP